MKGKLFKKKLGSKGQGVMEYVIISSLIGIFCLVAIKQYGEVVQKRISRMTSIISKNIKSR